MNWNSEKDPTRPHYDYMAFRPKVVLPRLTLTIAPVPEFLTDDQFLAMCGIDPNADNDQC